MIIPAVLVTAPYFILPKDPPKPVSYFKTKPSPHTHTPNRQSQNQLMLLLVLRGAGRGRTRLSLLLCHPNLSIVTLKSAPGSCTNPSVAGVEPVIVILISSLDVRGLIQT